MKLLLIADFDGDCKLGRKDIEMVIQRITDETLTEEEKTELIDQVPVILDKNQRDNRYLTSILC